LPLVQENKDWFVHLTRESFLQRLSQDYSLKLGSKHFKVMLDEKISV